MVLKKKKKVDNGSIGFQVSIIPRAPRSTRRWALGRKTADEHVCAMELLASIAGKLLQETESSASNHGSEEDNQQAHFNQVFVKKTLSKDRPPKVEEQGSCEGSVVSGEESQQKNPFRTPPEVESDNHWECSSTFIDSTRPYLKKENRDLIITSEILNKVESLKSEISDSEIKLSVDHQEVGGIAMVKNSFCLEQSAERSAVLAAVPSPNFQRQKLFSTWQKRDTKSDGRDEKVSTFSKSSTKYKSLRHPWRALDSKVRKLLPSKHWKVSPQLKNCECLEDDVARKSLNQKRRISYKRERYHRDFICKRRKLLDGGLVMTSFLNSKITTNSDNKEKIYNLDDSFKNTRGEMGKSSSVFGSQASFHPKNAHVKFSIKSFKIPELLIDVPETATVGSLKRTIVEAVTAILGGGLHVGVLLNGKKVGDDNRTLQQSGISCEENLNSLGFMLEPNLIQLIPASEHSALLESASTPEPLTSSIRCNTADTMVASDSSPSHNPSSNVCKKYEQQEVSPVQASSDSGEVSVTEKPTFESQALVCVAADTTYHLPLPLAIIPFTQKSKRLELSQRRIRRPFSVSEVEALVEAVEQLGTGRWRDVKLRAFENANHRTYVDLKDKWKTLVHTASISVQQRRGEPVPQELLDRVMAAHSYWSHHQSKQQQQQGKQLQPAETLKIADVPENE